MGRAEAANLDAEQPRQKSSLQLGKYQLLAVLGRGGMAEVFLALSRGAMGFDKLAVIKRLRPGLADDESFRTMFLDEARLAARLNHPNVVHTYEVGEHDGVYFMAMEYLEGQSLNKIVREAEKRGTPLEPVISARIISDALAGLHHAHTLKNFDGRPLDIIHRDISPHNLFVTYEGVTKVVDFGIAKAALSSTETEVGVLKGKVAYMSPEQATGAPIDARSDIFAMGIVLWELLTQRRLMTGDSAASTIHRLLTAPVPPVSSMRHGVHRSLDSIVECALEKDPDRRFPTALAMREAIEAYLATTGRPVRPDEIGERVGSMFVDVREAIRQQIQEQVEGAGNLRPQDSQARSDLSPRSDEGMLASGDLPILTAGGQSSSGIVQNPRSGGTALSPQGMAQQGMGPQATGGTGAIPVSIEMPITKPSPAGDAPAKSGVSRTVLIGGFAFLLLAAVGASVGTQWYMSARNAPPPPKDDSDFTAGPSSSTSVPANRPAPSAQANNGGTNNAPPPVTPAPLPNAPVTNPAANNPAVTNANPPSESSKGSRGHRTPPPPPPPAAAAEGGYLTFDTYPWTRVSEGGAVLGTTPLVHTAISAGTHNFMLDNPDQGIHQTYSVTVKPGESVTKRLGLK